MAKIFVRNRRRVGKGAGEPRFTIVAVEGLDLKIYARHIRRKELEALSESVGAEVVYLPGGDGDSEAGGSEAGGSEAGGSESGGAGMGRGRSEGGRSGGRRSGGFRRGHGGEE